MYKCTRVDTCIVYLKTVEFCKVVLNQELNVIASQLEGLGSSIVISITDIRIVHLYTCTTHVQKNNHTTSSTYSPCMMYGRTTHM